jgi:hypothetical protein
MYQELICLVPPYVRKLSRAPGSNGITRSFSWLVNDFALIWPEIREDVVPHPKKISKSWQDTSVVTIFKITGSRFDPP